MDQLTVKEGDAALVLRRNGDAEVILPNKEKYDWESGGDDAMRSITATVIIAGLVVGLDRDRDAVFAFLRKYTEGPSMKKRIHIYSAVAHMLCGAAVVLAILSLIVAGELITGSM